MSQQKVWKNHPELLINKFCFPQVRDVFIRSLILHHGADIQHICSFPEFHPYFRSEFAQPTLQLRKARDTQTHIGICTHTNKVALNGWQLSRMYSSVIILRSFFLKWNLLERTGNNTKQTSKQHVTIQ